MSPTLDLTGVRLKQCAKPNCSRRPIHRHHTGCEAMWLRHFRHKRYTKTFRAFRARYYEFRETDTAEICVYHHEEIHVIYLEIIQTVAGSKDHKPCRQWTWREANELMQKLRDRFAEWMKIETPGLEPKKYKGVGRPLGVSS